MPVPNLFESPLSKDQELFMQFLGELNLYGKLSGQITSQDIEKMASFDDDGNLRSLNLSYEHAPPPRAPDIFATHLLEIRLQQIPTSIIEFSHLNGLVLRNHPALLEFPEGLFNASLRRLIIDHVNFSSIPDSLNDSSLELLELSNLPLRQLTISEGFLEQLDMLKITRCVRLELNLTITQPHKIRKLIITGCHLEEFQIPHSFESNVLNFAMNKLTTFSLPTGSRVNMLFLYQNSLREIHFPEENIGVETLNLADNLLVSLPDNLSHQQSLKILHINRNNIRNIPRELTLLSRLEYLYLHGNPIESFDEYILKIRNLKFLSLPSELPESRILTIWISELKQRGCRISYL